MVGLSNDFAVSGNFVFISFGISSPREILAEGASMLSRNVRMRMDLESRSHSAKGRWAGAVLAATTLFLMGVFVMGIAASAQAVTPMYMIGKLTEVSFGNDTTTGLSAPYYSTNYLGIPFGQHCNSAHGTGTTACYATSSYQSAHDGSPLRGTGVVSVSASPGGPIALPASLLTVMLGTLPTAFSTPVFQKKPIGGVPGGSFSYYPPYIYSYSYADLKNAAGNFFGNGGPGNVTFNAISAGAGGGTLTTTQGAGKYGGTMRMLGTLQTHFAYANSGGLSIGTDNWLVDWMGAGVVTPGGAVSVATHYVKGTNKHNVLIVTNTNYISVSAFPWGTGKATAKATRGPFPTNFARSGYDSRTAGGAGNIQMVSPMLTHWRTPGGGVDYETAAIGVLTLSFTPEPSSAMLLVAGVSMLGLVYRSSRRG
jgi:hypothetical protein